jgi:hypothetical protein
MRRQLRVLVDDVPPARDVEHNAAAVRIENFVGCHFTAGAGMSAGANAASRRASSSGRSLALACRLESHVIGADLLAAFRAEQRPHDSDFDVAAARRRRRGSEGQSRGPVASGLRALVGMMISRGLTPGTYRGWAPGLLDLVRQRAAADAR